MEKQDRKITITTEGEFHAKIKVGDFIEPGVEVGYISKPSILERHEIAGVSKFFVDEGVLVSKNQVLFERRKGFYKETVQAQHEGIVRISKKELYIYADEEKIEVSATTWGRVLLTSHEGYSVSTPVYKIPVLVSKGTEKGGVLKLYSSIKEKNQQSIQHKIVLVEGHLTYNIYKELVEYDVAGILAASCSWEDYTRIFTDPTINVGILQGFGKLQLWKWYRHIFEKLKSTHIEVDFEKSFLYLPSNDIMLHAFKKELFVFKDLLWGKKVKGVEVISDSLFATLESGEKIGVIEEEIQKII
jgi:hypothetical protein